MKKLLIISAFVLFAFSSCDSDSLNVTENLNADGRRPQTGETLKIPATRPTDKDKTEEN